MSLEKITNLKHAKIKGHRKVKGTVSEKVATLPLVLFKFFIAKNVQ